MNILTRAAALSDVDSAYEFIYSLEDEVFDKAMFTTLYENNLNKEQHHYLLATVDDKPIGFISCHGQILLHHCGLVYEIQEMYVLPEYRSRGVGKVLLDALLARIKDDKYMLLEVCSSFKRADAHRFYEANGFDKATYKFKKVP